MNTLAEAKILGGIGAIVTLVGGFIPQIGPIINIIGLILIIMAVKTISDIAQDESIFRNYLIHFIFSIAVLLAMLSIVFIAFGVIGSYSLFSTMQQEPITDVSSFFALLLPLLAVCLIGFIIGWVLLVISSVYLRRSYSSIANHTDVDLFRTVGTLYFFGALTMIVIIGFILLFIAKVLEIVAFFSIEDEQTPEPVREPRRCPSCGRSIPEDALICPYCKRSFMIKRA